LDIILALPDPGNKAPYVAAMWHYARGVALARRGDVAADAIASIAKTADLTFLKDAGIPALDLLKLAQAVVDARIAQAKRDSATATARLTEAAAIQDTLHYTEPPYWYYPVRQSLAAALL
ncbi:MAG: hypothetical protein WBL84_00615, partial [Xanthobacteraceae bacterium]